MAEGTRQLALLSKARNAIAEAKTVQEVKQIIDKAEAIRCYAKSQDECMEIQQAAAEVKIRAQRRAGELLAAMELRGGDRKSKSRDVTLKLPELGVERMQSSRWQRIASIPEPTFEDHLATSLADEKELTTAGVLSLAKKTTNHKRNAEVVAEAKSSDDINALVASGERFACIYADPPWRYGNQATRASTDNHYPTMTVDEIAELPVDKLAADKSHLWLWTTNGFLFECPKLFDKWGFEFKSSYVWVKRQIGIGNYLRNSHEFLLLAVRGGMVGKATDVKSWGEFDRGAHSSKPEQIRKSVIEKVSPGPRLELFGRRLADGWTVWGNQISRTMFDAQL